MHKLLQVIRLDDRVCLVTYLNAFDSKMGYLLRDKNPRTLAEAYKLAINIESNRRISGKLGRREDCQPSVSNRREPGKPDAKPKDDDSLKQILKAIKDLRPGEARNSRV